MKRWMYWLVGAMLLAACLAALLSWGMARGWW